MAALIPLAISLAPEIGRWLFGRGAEATIAAVAQTVQAVTGTSDASAAQDVLARDPQAVLTLRAQLAQLAAAQEEADRQANLQELAAQLKDTSDARSQTIALVGAKSVIAFATPVVSVVVLVTFGVVMWVALTKTMPAGSETVLNMLLGTLAAMSTSVVSYWVGSSAGSARKDEHIAQQAAQRSV